MTTFHVQSHSIYTEYTNSVVGFFLIRERVCVNVVASFWVYDAFDATVTHMYSAHCTQQQHNQHLPAPNY